jgi:hypothetical protein
LDRLSDANALLAAGRSASSIASGLYALEMRLKVIICKRLDLMRLPKAFEIHDLEALLILTGLKKRLDDPGAEDVKMNWGNITAFGDSLNELRYLPDRNWHPTHAVTFLNWLEDPHAGVLTWLMKQT